MSALKKIMKTLPSEVLAAKGLLYEEWEALTPCQRECTTRLGMTIQIEQEAYLREHPEVIAMIELFLSKMTHTNKRNASFLKEATEFFLRPAKDIDAEIRERLGVPSGGPYLKHDMQKFNYEDNNLEKDLKNMTKKYYPEDPWLIPTSVVPTPDTLSSSFLSIQTSDTTLPTPEPIPTPEPTLSETLMALAWNTVDKAVYLHVNDDALRYDTAYVELSKAVEEAMEIPVLEIKQDIATLFYNAYKMFELDIMEKERIAAELAWSRRMRKKMKRTLRRQDNFKGYAATPPKPSSQSSRESDQRPPLRPCICHPQFHYNRYAKDRFGIYMPRDVNYAATNITVTPAISSESVNEDEDNKCDAKSVKSVMSRKSAISTKSIITISKKTLTFKTK